MDITSLLNVSSSAVAKAAQKAPTNTSIAHDQSFSALFQSAVDNLNETNSLLNNQEEEEIKFALGYTDSTHDLSIATAKASTALSYTVALRDRFIEAYNTIMQMTV